MMTKLAAILIGTAFATTLSVGLLATPAEMLGIAQALSRTAAGPDQRLAAQQLAAQQLAAQPPSAQPRSERAQLVDPTSLPIGWRSRGWTRTLL